MSGSFLEKSRFHGFISNLEDDLHAESANVLLSKNKIKKLLKWQLSYLTSDR